MKTSIIGKCARFVEKVASVGAGSVCVGYWHQPKVPKVLKEQK
jgi:cyclic lactone autoinducer peptide